MPTFELWDIVKVPFPYTNKPVRQRRPALIVNAGAGGGAFLWVLMITSAANRGWPDDIEISDLQVAGLPAASIVRTAKIATIDQADAERLGKLPMPDRAGVMEKLREQLSPLLG